MNITHEEYYCRRRNRFVPTTFGVEQVVELQIVLRATLADGRQAEAYLEVDPNYATWETLAFDAVALQASVRQFIRNTTNQEHHR